MFLNNFKSPWKSKEIWMLHFTMNLAQIFNWCLTSIIKSITRYSLRSMDKLALSSNHGISKMLVVMTFSHFMALMANLLLILRLKKSITSHSLDPTTLKMLPNSHLWLMTSWKCWYRVITMEFTLRNSMWVLK